LKYSLPRNLCIVFAAIFLASTFFVGCNQKPGDRDGEIEFLIGVSQANLVEPWRIAMNKEIEEEASKYSNVKVIFTNAARDSQKQISDIKTLMELGIDLLIVSPNNSAALTPVVTEVYKKIPVIVLDRAIEGYDYTLFIGPDNKMIGRKAGQLVVELLGNKGGNVIDIQGLEGSPPARDREEGFREIINQHSNIKIVNTIYADWLKDKAQDMVKDILKEHPKVDVIFAQNDAMAYGAYKAAKELNIEGIKFVGVDGLWGYEGGLELVKNGILSGTFTCSTGGKEAIRYAIDIFNHESGIPKKIILRSTQVTAANVDNYIDENNKSHLEETTEKEKITVGFSQVGSETEWRIANTNSILSAAKDEGIELIYHNANGSQQAQIDSMRYFIDKKVDAIILSPIVETGWDEVLAEAKNAGIPVILSNRQVKVEDESLYKTWIGSDFVEQGRRVARWLLDYMKEDEKIINIVEIEGTKGSTSSDGRKTGFEEVMKAHPNYRIIKSVSTDFSKETGKKMMERILQEEKRKIDILFAFSDDLGLGAIEAIEEYGLKPGKDIIVVSVDGERSAFEAMILGKLNCTVENNPLYGPQIMKVIKDIVAGKDIPVRIYSSERVFPADMARRELPKREY